MSRVLALMQPTLATDARGRLNRDAEHVGWYEHRWIVEDYHHCLKTGCHLEERQVQSAERLIRRLGLVVGTPNPLTAAAQILLVATLSVLLTRSSMRIYLPLWQHRPIKLPR